MTLPNFDNRTLFQIRQNACANRALRREQPEKRLGEYVGEPTPCEFVCPVIYDDVERNGVRQFAEIEG
jgi:hypothetical protein